jgi:hypothetical protein
MIGVSSQLPASGFRLPVSSFQPKGISCHVERHSNPPELSILLEAESWKRKL